MLLKESKIKLLIQESINNILLERKTSKIVSYIKSNFLSVDELTNKMLKLLGIPEQSLDIAKNSLIYNVMSSEINDIKNIVLNYLEKNESNLLNFLKTSTTPMNFIGEHFVENNPELALIKQNMQKLQKNPKVGELVQNLGKLSEKNEQEIVDIANDPLLSVLFQALIVQQFNYFSGSFLTNKEFDLKYKEEKKTVMQTLHRDAKRKFIKKNKDELKNWKMVHYPNAFLFDRDKGDQFTALYLYLKDNLGKINNNEMAAVAYPKDFPEVNDSLSTGVGNSSGRPGLGVVLDGFITFIHKKDVSSSTFDQHVYGGPRKSGGFVRYPGDKFEQYSADPTSFDSNTKPDFYLQDLPALRKNFESEVIGGYTEGFIDNSFPVAVVGDIQAVFNDLAKKSSKTRDSAKKSGLKLIKLGIPFQNKNFKIVDNNIILKMLNEL